MLQSNATRSSRVAAGLTRNTVERSRSSVLLSVPEFVGVPFFGLQHSLGGKYHDAMYSLHDQWILHFSPESMDAAVAAFCKSPEEIMSCGHHRSLERGTCPRVAVLKSTLAVISRLVSNHSVATVRER